MLQLNLCNSGRADCYSGGRAVSRAVALIHEHRPTIVTLNEICRDDLPVLTEAMSATDTATPATSVRAAFAAVQDRQTQGAVRCRNGQDFGAGVLVAVAPPAVDVRSSSGANPVQNPRDPEQRVWVCIDLATRFTACTTHSTSANRAIALEQCRQLLNAVVPKIRGDLADPVILGADLNLTAGGSPGAQACLPSGYQGADDDGLQHVVVSPGVGVRARSVLDMQGTTDHPGLLVDVVVPVARPRPAGGRS